MFKQLYTLFRHLRFTAWFYRAVFFLILLFVASYLFPVLFTLAMTLLFGLLCLSVGDAVLLFRHPDPLQSRREAQHQKLSNGDLNTIGLSLQSSYSFAVQVKIIDELPAQFQIRDFLISVRLAAGQQKKTELRAAPAQPGRISFWIHQPLRHFRSSAHRASPALIRASYDPRLPFFYQAAPV